MSVICQGRRRLHGNEGLLTGESVCLCATHTVGSFQEPLEASRVISDYDHHPNLFNNPRCVRACEVETRTFRHLPSAPPPAAVHVTQKARRETAGSRKRDCGTIRTTWGGCGVTFNSVLPQVSTVKHEFSHQPLRCCFHFTRKRSVTF